MKLGTKLALTSLFSSIISIAVILIVVNLYLREHALMMAEREAKLIIAEKQALIKYFANDLRPKVLETLKEAGVDNPQFEPVWMSAFYVNKKTTEYFRALGFKDYYYKNAAINARNPDNEAVQYEREYLEQAEKNHVAEKVAIVDIEGKSYLTYLKSNTSRFTEKCNLCHSTPDKAPSNLLAIYGSERAFNKKEGSLASVLSLRIPLDAAYLQINDLAIPVSILCIISLALSYLLQWHISKKQFVLPLERLTKKALAISSNNAQHEVVVEVGKTEEIADLSKAFNLMSTSLIKDKLQLEACVQERTAELAEATLSFQASEEKLRLLINSKAEAIYGVDMEGKCIYCNVSCLSLLGYEHEDELLGYNIHTLIHHTDIHGKRKPQVDCEVLKTIAENEKIHKEDDVFWCADGEWIQVEWWASPIIQDNNVIGAVVTFVNVAEQRKHQLKQVHANKLASLGEMAAGVAHEINNPINGIVNYAQLLLNRAEKDSYEKKVLEGLFKESLRIEKIVKTLLTHSYRDAEDFATVDLHSVVTDSLGLIGKQMEKEGIYLDCETPDNLPLVHGNKQQLEQVFINLVSNSRHALNERYSGADLDKILRISLAEESIDNRRHVILNVWDQGGGISDGVVDKVMNPFYTTKPAGVGTGLGLSISYDIVKNHGGQITIESEPGMSTLVSVSIPVEEKC